MKRKIIAILLVLATLLTLLPCHAKSKWTNILLLGGDSRQTSSYENTDTMMILSLNSEDRCIKLTSIMRDTWVELPGRKEPGKINSANTLGGPKYAVRTVNKNFSTNIENYILVNMADLVAIIDLVGGIDIEVTESELEQINAYAQDYINNIQQYDGQTVLEEAGYVHLNGLLATAYTRDRYTDSDFGRVMRQQKVIMALSDQIQNMELDELMAVVSDIYGHIKTNMNDDTLDALVQTVMLCDVEDIPRFRIPADGTYKSETRKGVWAIYPSYKKNAALLYDFIYKEGE